MWGYAELWTPDTRCNSIPNKIYFRRLKLQPNASKKEVSCFHINNTLAKRETQHKV